MTSTADFTGATESQQTVCPRSASHTAWKHPELLCGFLTLPRTVRQGLGSSSGCSSFTTPTQPYSYKSSSSLLLQSPSGCIWMQQSRRWSQCEADKEDKPHPPQLLSTTATALAFLRQGTLVLLFIYKMAAKREAKCACEHSLYDRSGRFPSVNVSWKLMLLDRNLFLPLWSLEYTLKADPIRNPPPPTYGQQLWAFLCFFGVAFPS